jgi:hypothetical protein
MVHIPSNNVGQHYSGPNVRHDRDHYSAKARGTRAQLEMLDKQIAVLQAEANRDPYETVCKLRLPPLKQLRADLQRKLRLEESGSGASSGSGGEQWRPTPSGIFSSGR